MFSNHTVKRGVSFLGLALVFLVGLSSVSLAEMHEFTPSDPDLGDLDHYKYYTWGIDWDVPDGETIVGASLFFDDIRNWDSQSNDLWVHLLNDPTLGVVTFTDNQGGGDAFAGDGVLLEHWEDLPPVAQDITYTFDAGELDALIDYVADGRVGLGFDPDCHFYNNGIKLTIETAVVPLPGAVLLGSLGFGVAGSFLRRRKDLV